VFNCKVHWASGNYLDVAPVQETRASATFPATLTHLLSGLGRRP